MDDRHLEELMVQSFIKIMMETEKSAEGKAELAQAQVRAEQRRNSHVSMKFGDDGLHIHTDNANESLAQPHLQPLSQQPPSSQYPMSLMSHPQQTLVYQPSYLNAKEQNLIATEDGIARTDPRSIPYPSSYVANISDFSNTSLPRPAPAVHANGSLPQYGNKLQENSLIPYNSSLDSLNYEALDDAALLEQIHRRRREGRDHTNYSFPPNLHQYKDQHMSSSGHLHDSLNPLGLPGLPVPTRDNLGGEDARLKLVVIDKTDDEEDSTNNTTSRNIASSQYHTTGLPINVHTDVYPIDKDAVDRDMYKQVYDPNSVEVLGYRRTSLVSLTGIPGRANSMVAINNQNIPSKFTQKNFTHASHPVNQTHPEIVFSVTDYDSESTLDTGRKSHNQNHRNSLLPYRSQPFQSQPPNSTSLNPTLPNIHGSSFPESSNHQSHSQQVYTMSPIDYERYLNSQSQFSTVRHEYDPGLPPTPGSSKELARFSSISGRTFVINSSFSQGTLNSSGKHEGQLPEERGPGPGYKFHVNQYNLAKRASILNRAERLLVARQTYYTDRSDSSSDDESTELQRIEEDEDESDDRVVAMNTLRQRALKQLKRRPMDDSTSYNSSDDVLHSMRFNPRGHISQTARRARLTSVNARLKKHKRIRAARRQVLRLPTPASISPDSSDSYQPPLPPSRGHTEDPTRYEESNLQDISNLTPRSNTGLAHDGDSNLGPAGRRVLFFRNGDIHFRPKQVLINNKTYANLEKLLVDLSSMVETSTGVKFIFSWPEGREVKSITEFQNGKYYVCSSTNKLQRVDYGSSKENYWKGGKLDRKENVLFQQNTQSQSPLRRPRVLTVVSNLARESRQKLILNTNSHMNFEHILNDITNMINIPSPPVRALYTERRPHQKVESYSQLIRDLADHDTFLACGEELVPLELSSRKLASTSDQTAVDRKKNPGVAARVGVPQEGSTTLAAPSSLKKSVTRGNTPRRRNSESVKVEINGKIREFFPPTQTSDKDDGLKPDKKLRLSWVYGYRGRDVKQNLAVLSSTEELVYFVAAVVVLYNRTLVTQRHYLGHSEEITCLAVHANGRFVATGQISGKTADTGAHVRVWDGLSLSTYAVLGLSVFQQGICSLSFSQAGSLKSDTTAGDLVMAVDESDRHTLTIWEWQTEKLVARTSTSTDPVVSGCFYPLDDLMLVTYGKEHLHFWRVFWGQDRKILRDKLSGNFQGPIPKYITSVCFTSNGDVISGDSSGSVLVWTRDNNSVFSINRQVSSQTKKAHKKSVSALCMLGDGTLLSGGGNLVKAWDSFNNYALVKERQLPESAGHVRTIVPINDTGLDGSIYVTTTRNKVLQGSLQLKFSFLIQGHVEELWAVEGHPLEDTFVSAGHDQTVVKWSANSHSPLWKINVENPCTCLSIDPRGRLIALGTTAGQVVILNAASGVQLTTLMSGNVQINAVSFSPDGQLLAMGTFDGLIQLFYSPTEGHNFYRPPTSQLKYNNVFIMHMDWSLDSKLLQVVLGDYEIVYWNVSTMQRIKSSRSLRDVQWATHNCPLGHPVIGPWHNLDRGDVINVVSRTHNKDLQVVGDTKGRLRLYKWPCSSVPKAGYRQTKVYSSNVTCATFTYNDHHLITSGGTDAALMQFSVLDTVHAR